MNKMIVIYKLTSPIGKIYVGQSNNLFGRLKQHYYSKRPIGCALQHYELKNFKIEILHKCLNKDEANKLEIIEIAKHNCQWPNGYNMTPGGENPPICKKGIIRSEEWRKRNSESHKGEKNNRYGKHHSEETRRKMSEIAKGKKHFWNIKRNKSRTGIKLSEITRLKMKISQMKRRLRELENS